MRFRLWLESLEWVITAEVPPEPGTSPLAKGLIRLYHYIKPESFLGPGYQHSDEELHKAAELVKQQGIDIGHSIGSRYGEPNVVWASREIPGDFKVFAEFGIAPGDERWGPHWRNDPPSENADCYFVDSIRPEEIVAVHEPWHHHYRYLEQSGLIERAKAGEFDGLLDNPGYGPAVRKAKG